jgi:hypothetical protein
LLLVSQRSSHLGTFEFAPQHRTLLLSDAMEGEHVLGRIDRDALKLHAGGPWLRFDNSTVARDAVGPSTQQPTHGLIVLAQSRVAIDRMRSGAAIHAMQHASMIALYVA